MTGYSGSNRTLFINGYLQKIKNRFNFKKGQELNEAFEVFSMAAILDKPFDEVYDHILVFGDKDGGIDGIYFEENEGEYLLHVFQCKNTKNLKQNLVHKFKNDFKDIFIEGNKQNKDNVEDLLPSYQHYVTLASSGKWIQPKLYFVFNGDKETKQYANNANVYNTYHQPNEDFEIWDANDLYERIGSLIQAQSKRKTVTYNFKPEVSNISSKKYQYSQSLISFYKVQVKAAIFRATAYQLCELLEEEKRVNKTIAKAFAENIRGFLGRDNITNRKIIETLESDQSVYFPFLNNGITIICEKFTLPLTPQGGKYILNTVNPVIVNGLQTTYLIYQQYLKDKKSLLDVDVTIRLYETDNPKLVELITDATNTQSAIDFADKLSNKPFNMLTKELFASKGVAYLTKKGETFTNPLSRDLKFSVRSEYLLNLWYSIFIETGYSLYDKVTTLAIIYKSTTNPKHPLHDLFNGHVESPLYSQLYFFYYVEKVCQNYFSKFYPKELDTSIDSYSAIPFYLWLLLRDLIQKQNHQPITYQSIIDNLKDNFKVFLYNKFPTYHKKNISIEKIKKLYINLDNLKDLSELED